MRAITVPLPQKQDHGKDDGGRAVAQHPYQMREDILTAAKHSTFKLDRMNQGWRIGAPIKSTLTSYGSNHMPLSHAERLVGNALSLYLRMNACQELSVPAIL